MKTFLKIKILSLITFLVFSCFSFEIIKAGNEHNLSGWAWSDNIGWIRFNSITPPDPDDDYNYGVDVDELTGIFSGYAWSDNIGWISFNEAELINCPSGTCQAKLDFLTDEVSGWAKTINIGDGWEEWISLRGSIPDYGVSFNDSNNEFEGWAWSDDFGWISFNSTTPDPDDDYNYKVQSSVTFSMPPDEPQALAETVDCCSRGTPQVALYTSVILSWTYSDPEGDPQMAYEIQLDDDDGFPDPKFNIVVDPSVSTSYTLDLNDDPGWSSELAWATAYYWRVRVKDNQSPNWSEWSDPPGSFTMKDHANPLADFQPLPSRPVVNEIVEFIQDDSAVAESLCYIGGTEGLCQDEPDAVVSYEWDFSYNSSDGFQVDETYKGNATTTYDSPGFYTVRLRITDINLLPAGDNSCYINRTINIGFPLPEWKEISPF